MSRSSLFHASRPVPAEYRSTFLHLFLDIAWFGVLAASAQAFVAVYAARLGATGTQIGLLTAGPAIVNLAFTLPAGRWLEKRPVGTSVFWTAAFTRFFYLLWVPLPLLASAQGQVWALIGLTVLLSVPGTGLAIGFNTLFAGAVPPEWRGHVVGLRNALMSVVYIGVSLLCGQLLVRLPFPANYQVVFGLGFVGAAMSTLHLWFLAPHRRGQPSPANGVGPGGAQATVSSSRSRRDLRSLFRVRGRRLLNTEVLRSRYGTFMAVLFAFYLTLYLAIPLFPLHWVNQLHLTDREIGWGNALFYVSMFVGSLQLARLAQRYGNQRMSAVGATLICFYPALMSVSRGLNLFLLASVIGGLGASMVNGAMVNYILEKVPGDNRPAYLAWYNLVLNAALLTGSLLGPLVAGLIGVRPALALFTGLRLLSALLILRWE